MQGYEVWIEAEHWSAGQWLPRNANSDVVVTFADGRRWAATFFSYENINAMRLKNQETGECLGGRYFWATDLVLVDEVSRSRIEAVVADLLTSGEFQSAFKSVDGASD